MEHLNEEQLVLHHYHDDDTPTAVEQHLASCGTCRAEFAKLRSVLALVDELPVPDRGDAYAEQVWNRLRWKLERRRRSTWLTGLAAAAILAVVFFAGEWWHARSRPVQPPQVIAQPQQAKLEKPAPDRILVFVVGDHLDNSERMLLEVANADPKRELDLSTESKRAADLVASNRIYRQTATQKGDERIASVLSDLEPILVELSHADKISPEELKSLQNRIETKGLLFKVRVLSAETNGGEAPLTPQKGTNSL